MTPAQRARIVAQGAEAAAKVLPPMSDETADALAQLLADPPPPMIVGVSKRVPERRAA